jgi:endoglucanase
MLKMRKESIDLLQSLVDIPSPVGHETRGVRCWLDALAPYADETYSDSYGNSVAVLNKGGGPRLMLAAHADEIALTVNYISDEGYLYVRRSGGVDPAIMKAQRVLIHTREGDVLGVVGNVAPHLMRTEKDGPKPPKIHELFIDIGATSREDALKRVRIGDPMTVQQSFQMLHGNLAIARGFDNRIGTWSVAEAIRLLHPLAGQLEVEVCAVANVQEEVGLLGAKQIAYSLNPDMALVVDVTHATDYPTVDKRQHGDIRLGAGPVITHGGCNHPEVVRRLEEVASNEGIALQHETMSASSGTDTDVIFWTRGGIPSGLISLPNRYMHSPVEMIHLEDLEKIPRLMTAFAQSVKRDHQFRVRI